jgi:uncharacterized protein
MALPPYAVLAAAIVVLSVANLLNNRYAPRVYMATSVVATGLLLGLLGLAGLGPSDAGLGWAAVGEGLWWGIALGGVVAAGYLVAAVLPVTRGVFLDRRVEQTGVATLAYQTLLRIPVGTVLLEEVAFRGVLYGLLTHCWGVVWATAASSAMFGLWHVLPARDLVRLNRAAGQWFATRAVLVVPVAVLATAVAGVVLCELRRRTGSLLPAFSVHWAVNALGYLTAFLVTRRAGRGQGGAGTAAARA